MIELRTLGAAELRAPDESDPAALLAHPKLFALLAYLAASRPHGPRRRDALVGLFWPELDQEHARGALRKALHRLRRTIGPQSIVVSGDESIGIDDAALWCDVRAFDAAVDSGRPVEALALYGGDFLPGLFIADAPEFERWVADQRRELRSSAVRAAWLAAAHAESAGDAMAAARWARQATDLVPDDEQGVRLLIELLDRIGDRAGAIRSYTQFERHLAAEFQVVPSPETVALVGRLRSNSAAARPTVQPDRRERSTSGPDRRPATVPPRSRPVAAWVGAGSLGAAAVAAALVVMRASSPVAPAPAALDHARVAVMPLENRTNRPDLDFVGLEAQDWITQGLQTTGLVRAFPARASDTARQWAARRGVGTLIRGRYYARGDSVLLLQVSIIDAGTGEAVALLPPVTAPVRDPTAGIEILRRRTLGVLATHLDPALNQWARSASQPPSFEAYREFATGLQAFNHDDYRGAITHYRRASTRDPDYVYPLIMAAGLELAVFHARAAADSLVRVVRTRRAALAPYDDALTSALEAQLAGDLERSYEASQQLRRFVVPGGAEDLDAAALAVALNRPREAMALVKAFNADRPTALDTWTVFVPIINAHHLAGEDAALLAWLRRDAGPWAQAPIVVIGRMVALTALARPAEVAPQWRTLLHSRDGDAAQGALYGALVGARELRAHGAPAAARALAREALDSIQAMRVPAAADWPYAMEIGVLREAGRDREALTLARAQLATRPRDAALTGTMAAIAAHLGDSATARTAAAQLAAWRPAADRRELLVTRARVAAALGDPGGAVALLHAACDHGCESFEDLHSFLDFDALRSYPPFRELLRPMR